ncbi:MAG TPA: autotransporter assembly complex protein TamA [Candidatus Anaerobiospirillum stercoravium]|nr:autotransporter assembly complex protein TamA [Candidatus Anaerobiospirillum stercoravium]
MTVNDANAALLMPPPSAPVTAVTEPTTAPRALPKLRPAAGGARRGAAARGIKRGIKLGFQHWFKCWVSCWARALGLVLLGLLVSSCASDNDLPQYEVLVTDPVSFEVHGISGELLTNVEAHLNAMAVISKQRVRFYRREIQETAQRALRAYGYYHPTIEVTMPERDNPNDRVVHVTIAQGKPLFVRYCTMEILGDGAQYQVFNDLLAQSPLKSYAILNHGAYEELKNQIHQNALALGLFDGRFISSRIVVYQDQNMADIELIYDSGKRYKFGEIIMDEETERLYRPSHRLQNFQPGDEFATATVNSFISALNQTDYYNAVDVRPNTDELKDYTVPVEMHLERRPNNLMRLGVGYNTDEGIRLLAEWNKPLLNERGDSLAALTTLTLDTQEAQMIYKIPHKNPNLDYFTINAIQTHTELNDTKSDRSHLAFHYIDNMTGKWRRDYSLRAEYEDYSQGSEDGYAFNIIPSVQLTRRESSGGFDPQRGYSLSLEVLGGSSMWGDNDFLQFNALYRGQIAPTDNTRLLFRLEQGATFGSDSLTVPPSLRYFAGGDNSIRGFSYRSRAPHHDNDPSLKGGRYLTTGTLEFQFPCGISNSRLAVFLDAGLATDNYDHAVSDNLLYGPGIGYRFLSPYGIVRVDIAMGIQRNSDEREYNLHFAFGPEF